MAAENEQPICIDMDLPAHLQYGSLGTAMKWELWSAGAGPVELTVGFVDDAGAMDNFAKLRDFVKRIAPIWSEHAYARFLFCDETGGDPSQANIRVSFSQPGNWSYIGKQASNIPKPHPTMNLGSLRDRLGEAEYRRIVLHEFGHALGLVHEHQNPNIKYTDENGAVHVGIPWDKKAVYDYYKDTYDWGVTKVDQNVFYRYDTDILRATEFDLASIMIYAIQGRFTGGRFEVGWNNDLSPMDISFIASLYPKPSQQ